MDWRDDHSLGTEGSETPFDNRQVWLTCRFPMIIPVYLGGRTKIQEIQQRGLDLPLCGHHFLTSENGGPLQTKP